MKNNIKKLHNYLIDNLNYEMPTQYKMVKHYSIIKEYPLVHNLRIEEDSNMITISDEDEILSGYDTCCFFLSSITQPVMITKKVVKIIFGQDLYITIEKLI